MRQAKALIEECKHDLDERGVAYNKDIEVGTMIETPAASLIADDLAAECDFFSIGTNDLIGYTMCADRGNDRVSYLYQVYQPAVLRSLKRIIGEGNKAGIMVGMCGEAAADPLLIPILMSLAWTSTPSPLPPSCARGGFVSPLDPRRRPTPWLRRSWLSRPQPRVKAMLQAAAK